MKKILLMTAIAAMGLGGCDKRPEPLKIDNALTAEEIAAGRLTPEVMWKMSRAGGSSLSPDGRTLLYQQTDYNMAENRGVTTIRVEDMDSKAVTCLTDFTSNSLSPKWSADGRHIYFLSDRGGSMQVWRMNASGGDATQITGSGDGEGVPDVEGFGVSPDGKHIWWVQTVRTADRRSSDIYKDMDKSKARIYDDLMARHWDYWDEGEYRHIFVGELGKGVVTGGRDIMPDAQWDAPLAPYFDMAEIAWNNAGTMLAYTCKPLTGTAYAVSTDSDIFVYDLESGATQNICKPTNFNTGKPVNDQAAMRITTGMLNNVLADAQARVQPPTDKGRRLKIFYMTQASTRPPTFVCFVNRKDLFHYSYQRYIDNQIRSVFGLEGTPTRMIIRERESNKK